MILLCAFWWSFLLLVLFVCGWELGEGVAEIGSGRCQREGVGVALFSGFGWF